MHFCIVLFHAKNRKQESVETGLKNGAECAIFGDEERAYIQKPDGKMNGSTKGGAKSNGTKSVGNSVGAHRMSAKERARVSHQIATDTPELKADGTVYSCFNRKYMYTFTVVETGTYMFSEKRKIPGSTIYKKKGK